MYNGKALLGFMILYEKRQSRLIMHTLSRPFRGMIILDLSLFSIPLLLDD